MTSPHSTPHSTPSGWTTRTSNRVLPARAGVDRRLLIAAALFLAVLIVEAAIIAVAAPTIADIGSLYATGT
jgi:hypothetical protein